MIFIRRYTRELSVAAVYLLVLGVLAIGARPAFFQSKFGANWVSAAPVLVAAIGMSLVIIARQIDVSIGSQFCACGVLAGLLAKTGLPMPLVVALTTLAGAVLGLTNGLLVAMLELPSIVVTLAMMVILRESLRWARQGDAIRGLPDHFQWLGFGQTAGQWLLVLFAFAIFGVFAWSMRWLATGRTVYAVGSDAEAVRLTGVRPKRVVLITFILMGALTALASIMNAVRFPQVDPNSGAGLELQVIAAVVVGGIAISGGRGTLLGTLIGVALLATIGSALAFLGVQTAWERAIQGTIILAAVASDGLGKRRDAA